MKSGRKLQLWSVILPQLSINECNWVTNKCNLLARGQTNSSSSVSPQWQSSPTPSKLHPRANSWRPPTVATRTFVNISASRSSAARLKTSKLYSFPPNTKLWISAGWQWEKNHKNFQTALLERKYSVSPRISTKQGTVYKSRGRETVERAWENWVSPRLSPSILPKPILTSRDSSPSPLGFGFRVNFCPACVGQRWKMAIIVCWWGRS